MSEDKTVIINPHDDDNKISSADKMKIALMIAVAGAVAVGLFGSEMSNAVSGWVEGTALETAWDVARNPSEAISQAWEDHWTIPPDLPMGERLHAMVLKGLKTALISLVGTCAVGGTLYLMSDKMRLVAHTMIEEITGINLGKNDYRDR